MNAAHALPPPPTARLMGRESLLQDICQWRVAGAVGVLHLHGLPGIGKSVLLAAAAAAARADGWEVIEIDCHAAEPTDAGALAALGRALGNRFSTLAALATALAEHAVPTLIVLDHYEAWRLLDTWVRQAFAPALPAGVRLLIGCRYAPAPPWLFDRQWQSAFRSIELGPLEQASALAVLCEAGFSREQAHGVWQVTSGHPLALTLAIANRNGQPDTPAAAASEGVVGALATLFLEATADSATRQALEAAAVTRRTTEPLLAAQCGAGANARRLYGRLEQLPFVCATEDGLAVHESVKRAVALRLRARNPLRYRELRRAAWRELQQELRGVSESELWRYTADVLYLLENPALREGFFPGSAPSLVVEPARPADHTAIRAIFRQHDGPAAAQILEAWLAHAPQAFSVVRDHAGAVAGFRCTAMSNEISPALSQRDPVVAQWLAHRATAGADTPPTLFVRRWLDRDRGEGPGEVQGLCWIDCKRTYLRLRPAIDGVYIAMRQPEVYQAGLAVLGFRPVPGEPPLIDGAPMPSLASAFGPGSVDGWLARLLSSELGLDSASLLDEPGRQLVIDGLTVPLTPLEFKVFRHLLNHAGAVVSRAELVDAAWGYDYRGGSNVDAVVVRSLRAKLGRYADQLATVPRVGYCWRAP